MVITAQPLEEVADQAVVVAHLMVLLERLHKPVMVVEQDMGLQVALRFQVMVLRVVVALEQ